MDSSYLFLRSLPFTRPKKSQNFFFQCFDQSAIELFRQFIARHPAVRKWIIAADFSQHNDRPFDCFAFTVIPYDAWPAEIETDVKQALPKDLKKSKRALMIKRSNGSAICAAFTSR